uniref:Uncharacterized protein n=1 Tax=Avena sativa TaxID=4498 RepID=A0ACD5Z2V2_AVESA
MANPSNLQITPFRGSALENTQFNLRNLFLHQIVSGDDRNQAILIDGKPTPSTNFGQTAVNDWAIYEGVGSDATLVARAQGMHMRADSFYNSFIMVFKAERFNGSTLEIMGASLEEISTNDWAIVGGTGVFAMARGVIERKEPEVTETGKIQELNINGFCRRKLAWTKLGPWGNQGSSTHDITEKPGHLVSVTIFSGVVFDAISFAYIDENGTSRTSGRWGGFGGNSTVIQLGSSEFVKGLSGTIVANYLGFLNIISSFKLVTTVRTYGPFGSQVGGTSFQASVPEDATIEGFFGSSNQIYMTSIGAYKISQE